MRQLFIFSFMDSFVFKQQVLFRFDFLSVTLDHKGTVPQDGARGQNLGHLKKSIFFCFYFALMLSIIFKEQVLFRVDFLPVTSDSRVIFCFFIFCGINRHYLGLT